MEESEDNMSAEEIKTAGVHTKTKPKKRSQIERELETSLTARVTSPLTNGGSTTTSRYGRARRMKSDAEFCNEKSSKSQKSPRLDKSQSPSKSQSPAYKMHASNSPIRIETPKRDTLENQIENISNENFSLSRFSSEEKAPKSATKKFPKVYVRKDLIQSKDKEDDTVVLIKNIFSPSKSGKKSNTHLSNYLDRSAEKHDTKKPMHTHLNTLSVVKTLDFDGKKKKKEEKKTGLSKNELFDLEAKSEYQVGDLAWARMGTYPFWPCIITRDPLSGMFVKKKLFGRIERDVLHVTFFGDNGRRGWIVGTMLRKFLGQLEFEAAKTNFTPEAKKKDPRLYAAFFISDKKMPQWVVSVDEAEFLLKEPKRLRIDILNDMLQKGREIKTTPKHDKSNRIVRTNSDVSLSESLLDTLFSEDDSKGNYSERSRSKSGNRTLDVSEVVTACLDNMAAKTGITKIQRQSHMDRWLQKAKSKTPEKSHLTSHLSLKIEKDTKVSNTAKLKKKLPKKSPPNKPYNFRKLTTESQNETDNKLMSHQNDHDNSLRYHERNSPAILDDVEIEYENAEMFTSDIVEPGSGLGVISKVETLCGKEPTDNNDQTGQTTTLVDDELNENDSNDIEHNIDLENQVSIVNGHKQAINNTQQHFTDEPVIMEISEITKKKELLETVEATKTEKDENNLNTLSSNDNYTATNEVNLKDSKCYVIVKDVLNDKSINVCESHTKPNKENPICRTNSATISGQEISLMDASIVSETTVTNKQNSLNSNVLDEASAKDKGSHSNICDDEITSSNALCVTPDKDMDNVTSTTEKVLIENVSQDLELRSNNCATLPNVSAKDDETDAVLEVCTNDSNKNIDEITFEQESQAKRNSTPTNNLETNILIQNNIKTQNLEEPNFSNKNDYGHDQIKHLSDITENEEKSPIDGVNGETISLDEELKSITEISKTDLITQSSEESSDVNSKKPESDNVSSPFTNTFEESRNQSDTLNVVSSEDDKKYMHGESPKLYKSNTKKGKVEQAEATKCEKKLLSNIEVDTFSSSEGHNLNTRCLETAIDAENLKENSDDRITESVSDVSTCSHDMDDQSKEEKRRKDLKEFEAQLYNIFGLSNKTPPKSKFNLSLKKSCKNMDDDEDMQIISDDESVCVKSKVQNKTSKANAENTNQNGLVSVVVEEDPTEKEQSKVLSRHLLNKLADTNSVEQNNESFHLKFKSFVRETSIKSTTETKKKREKYVDVVSDEDDNDRIEKKSEENDLSPEKVNLRAHDKLSVGDLENPEFLKYVELKQDSLIEEQPELNKEEIINYLYKTWLYHENLKTDMKVDIQNVKPVNGLKSPIKIKLSLNKISKNNKKSYKVKITNDNENGETIPKDDSSKNDDSYLHVKESSPKRSKRIKRANHCKSSFEKYFLSTVKKDSLSNNILELTPKGVEVKETHTHLIEIELSPVKKNTTCTDLATVSDKSSTQNDCANGQLQKNIISPDKTEGVPKLSPKLSSLTMLNGYHEPDCHNLKSKKTSMNEFDDERNFTGGDKPQASNQSKLTISKKQSACNGELNNKTIEDLADDDYEPEKDDVDSISIESEDSEASSNNKKSRIDDKLSSSKRKALEEPEFLKYLELKQDTLIDEHPELTKEEVTQYLYKTWLYEEQGNLKIDVKREDNIEAAATFFKVMNRQSAPVKRVRKKKAEKDKQIDFNIDSEEIIRKEKSKRKTVGPYFYKEHFSDIEDDIEFFEIFKSKSKTPSPAVDVIKTNDERTDEQKLDDEENDEVVEFVDEIDEVEEYFRQLTVPKPNVFKGMVREKVCEICEKVNNLIKCKGCHCMFHIDCVKKKTEVVEQTATTVRGRKKKKKPRGRKAKDNNSLDSEGNSDEKSHDANASDEIHNTSLENEMESDVVVNADEFETQLSLKMKELLENPENKAYESFSSADELDWDDIDYGECKIVDVLPRKKDRVDIDLSNFKCNDCQKYDTPVCFVCKSAVSPKYKAEHRQRCQVSHCNKFYHSECLDHWPQTQFNAGELSRINNSNQLVEALTCPRHVCHTCVCDDPRGCKTRFSGDKLARCVRCPATYHTFTKCLPAGSQILTASHIICPRHYEHRPGKVPCHVNTGWCFICALGGTLICCEYCPTSFHAECLNIDPPEGGYMCEDCETGRLPLYGEMVWVKLGHYRWWPGITLHPSEIPSNILAVKHSQGEFVVRFFGQYDYYWVNRGRVFPFQEGDSGRVSSQRSKIDAAFTMAMEHAQRACEILKTASPNDEESLDIASSLLPPHYVKLKVNKPCGSLCGKKIDIEESSLTQCECDPNELDPCGPYTQCLNRMLLTECGPTCRAGDRCNNRAFEKRLYPKMTPYRTPHRGWGLKTLEDIRAGQFVIEYVGELIDEEEFRRRMRRKQEVRDENFYYLTLDKERMIDAGPKGNLARFMNHSCEPNCETQKWTVLGDVRVGLFAIYDIPANSELTFNYNLESTGIEKKQCMCGAKRCSGYIGEKPKQDDQPKKSKQTSIQQKRTYKKKKNIEVSPPAKPKQRTSRPYKPRELTEIEKDLLIIKNATNGTSSDSESSSRLSSDSKDSKGVKRRRTEDVSSPTTSSSPTTKKIKTEKLLQVTENDVKFQEVLTEKIIEIH